MNTPLYRIAAQYRQAAEQLADLAADEAVVNDTLASLSGKLTAKATSIAMMPAEFLRQPEPPSPMPDKTRLKQALQHGQAIPGCRLMRGQRLDIQ